MSEIHKRLNRLQDQAEAQINRDIEKSATRMDNLINNREHALKNSDQKQFQTIEKAMESEQKTLDSLLTIPVPAQETKTSSPPQSERYVRSRWDKACQATIDEREENTNE